MVQRLAGQLDEISMKLGKLTAYTHEHRHGVANLSAKMDGLSIAVARQIAALEAKMTVRMEENHTSLASRNTTLQAKEQTRIGSSLARQAIITWWPAIVALLGFVFIILHSSGVLQMPNDNPTMIVAPPLPAAHSAP